MADPNNQGGGLEIDIRAGRRDQTFAPDITREGQLPGGTLPPPIPAAVPPKDAGTDYLVERSRSESDALLERARSLYGVQPVAALKPPTAGAPGDTVPGSSPGAAPAGPLPSQQAPGASSQQPAQTWAQGNPLDDLKALPDLARSVGREAVRTPRAVAAGVASAGKELFEAGDSLATWLNTNVVDLTLPSTGVSWLDNPAAAIAAAIPVPETPNTATGPIVKEISQFLAGMVGGGKLLKGAGATVQGAKGSLAAGAVSDALFFDPNEDNLAALLNKVPELEKVVPDFLATKPDDNEALNRVRRAVEGLGLGAATDAVVAGLRAYRAQRAATGGEQAAAMQAAKQKYGSLTSDDLVKLLGDPDPKAKLVTIGKKGDAAAAAADKAPDAKKLVEAADDLGRQADTINEPKPAKGDLPGGAIAINWARISTGDDVKVVMRELADHFKAEITKARRGKISQAETVKLADQLGMTEADLLARRDGQAFNAEETFAARRLLTMASEQLLEAARRAGDPNAGPVDLFAFRRMVATHAAIQNEVLAARAEAGRALAAWKIPAAASGDVERSRAIVEALQAAGGDRMARELARRMSILADSGAGEAAIAQVAQRGWGAATWDAVAEVWINGLLSSPKTHIVNVSSNALVLAQQILERGIAEKLAILTTEGGARPIGVSPGEAMAMASAVITAQRDAWRMAWLALKSGETGHALGKVDLPHQRALTAESFRIENDAVAKTVDFLGTVARVPSRLLGAEDEFFKTIGYRMELNAQAVRQATGEGLQGQDLRKRVADIVANPPENIRLAATDAALYNTFTQHAGDAAEALLRLREAWPATMYVLPFVRTPINILAYGFERTPLAPLMQGFRDDVAAGGARRELALVRMATGTSIMLAAADYADRGLITGQGPKDAGKREALMRTGWQPYSIRVGDKWVAYDRADPYGLLFGFAADMAEVANRMDVEGDKLDEFSEILAAGVTAISSTTVNKTYLRGLADLMWTIEDPQRRAFGYVGSTMGSFVPAGVAAMKAMDDPVLKENFRAWDYVRGRLPGLSAGMVVARDLWGKERQPDSGLGTAYDGLAPLRVTVRKDSPIDAEMSRLNMGVERIDKKTIVEGVPINFRDWPEVYDHYVVLAGNALKHPAWNLGAKDFLDQVVTGKHPLSEQYARLGEGPEGGKADFIKATIRDYRKMAQAAILADPAFPTFQAAWREARDVQNERRSRLEGQPQVQTPAIQRPMPPGAPPASISPMRVPQ